jgi:hypothetical protein
MFSTGKRRRERIRAKQAAREANAVAIETIEIGTPRPRPNNDRHVTAMPGKKARILRRSQRHRHSADSANENVRNNVGWLMWRGAAIAVKPLTLRHRRAQRRRERERREGLDRPEVRVKPRGVIWISWRWLSALISLFLIIMIYVMLASPIFFVDSIAVGGERYLTPEQVFEAADIANRNLFWLDAADIEARLESNPSIADAQVFVGWPPNMVSIFIIERDPAMIWEQGSTRYWVDVNGIVMFARREREDLLRVVYQGTDPSTLGVGSVIDRQIVAGALQLKAKLPNIEVMLYDPIKGLGIREEQRGNWKAWFGVGTDMELRLLVYNAIVNTYNPTIQFAEVDVSDADHPTFVNRFPGQ